MNETAFFDTPERSYHSDEGFGPLGRALYFAQVYESNCRVLASLLDLKSGNVVLPSDDNERQEVIQNLWKRNLGNNLKHLKNSYHLPTDIFSILDKAREARNFIAHEICLGINDTIESDKGRSQLIEIIKKNIEKIANGDKYVCLIIQMMTKEPIPNAKYFEEYPKNISKWVCEVYEE